MPVNQQDFNRSLAADTTRFDSPAIWADCPIDSLRSRPSQGIFRYEDWSNVLPSGTITTVANFSGKYQAFATSAGAINHVTSINSVETQGGALEFTLDGSGDGSSATIMDSRPQFFLSGLTSNSGPLWMEACIAVSTLATATSGFFFGLAETDLLTLATGVPFSASTGAVTATAAMIGWGKINTDLGVLNTQFSDRTAAVPTAIQATAGTLTAAFAFAKLGIKYDPTKRGTDATDPRNCALQFYFNNQICSTGMTAATLIAKTNLDANPLGFMFSTVQKTTASKYYLKWVQLAQLF